GRASERDGNERASGAGRPFAEGEGRDPEASAASRPGARPAERASGTEMSESADPRVGTVVAARYRLVGRIGRGGVGAIYQATHLTTGKQFAVKTLLPGLGRITEIAKRFEREALAASRLSHPNIVSVVDFGALDDGALFLAMDLVSGRSLGEIAKEGVTPARAFATVR